nr:6-phosphofructo-2-kinase/fructose-2,6-bisphosphatase-like isoform X2 [Physcomitrium patens]|eukprot:XP_024359920.1 6-phosphofructo-2-kinase/fructose-2,6-bisphosphatase-like isoform X2 [Physcomitrella patens]
MVLFQHTLACLAGGLLDFKFLLKSTGDGNVCILEEGANRMLQAGTMEGKAGPTAQFKFPTKNGIQLLQLAVSIQADSVSPFALASSWRSLRKNLQSHGSMVLGIPDVAVEGEYPVASSEIEKKAQALELDLEQYEVPTPDAISDSASQDAFPSTPDSTTLQRSFSLPAPFYGESSLFRIRGGDKSVSTRRNSAEIARKAVLKDRFVPIKDLVPLETESEAADKQSTQNLSNGAELDKTEIVVGPLSRVVSISSETDGDAHLESVIGAMPEAAGAVAAGAVADHMLGSKERGQLAIILVGLPARGKTFTAAKLTRYLRWLGHDTKHFNVGKYRRLKHGRNQTAEFFRGDNQQGIEARNEVAVLAMEDMLAWMDEGGQVGVFDATNSTKARRNLLLSLAEGKCKVIFLEIICNDRAVIEANIELKSTGSPDYADMPDYETALEDFRTRLDHYEKMYEPVTEGSYIKLIDMVRGQGGHVQVSNISGYLPGRIVFFLVNTHITPRPIFLTRHGESEDNVRGRIGGDPVLSEAGEKYALKLADFVHKRLKNESAASIWTSTLQRTGITARHIEEFPKVQWRVLDEINAGVCDGMTYEEIKQHMPEEYSARKADKLRYRYPRGESYLDVIQRVEPVIVELERQRSPVVVIAHQAILRSLYAYFMDKPLKEVPHIQVPLHTIIEIQMGVAGMQEKRYKLMETST